MSINKVVSLAPSNTMQPEQALHSALSVEPTQVLVVGYDDKGVLFTRSSHMTCAEALWLLEMAKQWLLGSAK